MEQFVGTFGAIGFLTAYFLISIAAPVYLYRDGNLKPGNVGVYATVIRGGTIRRDDALRLM